MDVIDHSQGFNTKAQPTHDTFETEMNASDEKHY